MLPRVVLCNGCFDLFHYGHLLHLQAAKEMGDYLVVSITLDDFVSKGKNRPVFTDSQRQALVASLKCVDDTILVANSLEALQEVEPNVFVKGIEYADSMSKTDRDYCDKHGIEIAFTDEQTYSSTNLLRYFESKRS